MLRKGNRSRIVGYENESFIDTAAESTPFSDLVAYTAREELKSQIRETFEKMTGKQALVVRLHDMEGITIQEIARIIRCPVGTVKSRLFYGRQEFKALFNSLRYKELAPSSLTVH